MTTSAATPTPLTDWSRRYGLDDIEQFLDPAPAPPEPEAKRSVPYIGPERPGDAFNARHTGGEILTRLGFTIARRDRSGDEHWVRPGKERRQGTSATVYGDDGHTTIWSDTCTAMWPAIETRRPYDPFGLYATTSHAGDFQVATTELARQGYGEPRPPTDLAWFNPGPLPTVSVEQAAAAVEPWPDPEPLEPAITHGEPFPVDVLPPWIARQVVSVADSFQVPVDLPAMFALGVLSAVVMGHLKVKVTGTDWVEYTNLYLTAALPPGAGKTPAFKAMARCVTELETELIADAQQTIREATIRRAVLEKRAKQAFESAALKSGSVDEAVRAQAEFDALDIPSPPRLLADDATPESLAVLMSEHGGRMNLLSDEGDVFDIMAGQYAQAGKSTNLSPYLKGHSAGAIKQDRIGRARISIPEALLTVCVATQPRVLAKLGENPELAGRGLSSRFMYCVPASNVGFRDRYAVLRDRDVDAQRTYDNTVKDLGRHHRRYTFPVTLDLSVEARDLFLEWDQQIENRLRPGADLSPVAEWAMKLRSGVLRLAGLLHVADGAQGDISAGALERALVVAGYWTDHACRVHATWGSAADLSLRRARQIVAWATKVGDTRDSFTVREAYVECRNHDGSIKVDAVHDAIERLVETGWARTGSDYPGGKGRKSPTIQLHPDASDVLAHIAHMGGKASHDPGCARCARSALMERYAFSSSLSTGKSEDENNSLLSRFAHNAHIENGSAEPSPPPSVAEPEPPLINAEPPAPTPNTDDEIPPEPVSWRQFECECGRPTDTWCPRCDPEQAARSEPANAAALDAVAEVPLRPAPDLDPDGDAWRLW